MVGSAEYLTLMTLKAEGFRRLLIDLPCRCHLLQIPAHGMPLTSHLHAVLSALV